MAGKKIIVVLGSPRKEGNSTTLAKRVIAGAKASGAEVEAFYLHDMNISPCMACDECRDDPAKDCVIDDQMKALYPKLRRADALVIASPIYWFTMSAQTKLFMDRCYALGGPDGHALQGKQIPRPLLDHRLHDHGVDRRRVAPGRVGIGRGRVLAPDHLPQAARPARESRSGRTGPR
jgi:hypothetical protein